MEKVMFFVTVLQDSFPVTKLHVSGQDLAYFEFTDYKQMN